MFIYDQVHWKSLKFGRMSTAGENTLDMLNSWSKKGKVGIKHCCAIGLIPFGGQAGGKPLVEHCCFIGHSTSCCQNKRSKGSVFNLSHSLFM